MKKLNQLKYIPVLLFLILALPVIAIAGKFKVIRVYDGDTVKAIGHDIEIKVRLVGIDSPETSKKKGVPGQPFSQKAAKHLAGMVLNKTVDIKGYGLGPYNRILGVIHVDGKNANLEMIKAGFAEMYRGKPPKGFSTAPYKKAEAKAKKAGRGIWSQGKKYISPKDWRNMKKGK